MKDSPLVLRVVLTLAFMALLAAGSIVPGQARPGDSAFVWMVAKTPTLVQKAMHVVTYAMLAVLWVWTLDAIQSRTQRMLFAVIIAISFGAALESYQTRVPGRFGTIYDVALNASGALIGVAIALLLL
jgi:hypothetical protein